MLAILKAIRQLLAETPDAWASAPEICTPDTGTYADGALPLQAIDPKSVRGEPARSAFLRDYGRGRTVRPEGAGYA
ncbi:hypothetical protein [Ciceribacter thiooxidans]|uniref:Uncharacterized protein n=1 Tax=Ciceribacter thiooxidans TaxID=1969821 RepID=A0ABV7IC03_9HYPH|nr:hypothetical protein [Ciceribacter thiooxidans]MDI6835229.1 hypothetical protein [Rhizobiaceae bacterium]